MRTWFSISATAAVVVLMISGCRDNQSRQTVRKAPEELSTPASSVEPLEKRPTSVDPVPPPAKAAVEPENARTIADNTPATSETKAASDSSESTVTASATSQSNNTEVTFSTVSDVTANRQQILDAREEPAYVTVTILQSPSEIRTSLESIAGSGAVENNSAVYTVEDTSGTQTGRAIPVANKGYFSMKLDRPVDLPTTVTVSFILEDGLTKSVSTVIDQLTPVRD